jgi:hypothetical protein
MKTAADVIGEIEVPQQQRARSLEAGLDFIVQVEHRAARDLQTW